jgi:DNA-binding transcriptional regulator YbjK
MENPKLESQILKEISRKAYQLQISAGLAQNAGSSFILDDLLKTEKALHHEMKRLRKLIQKYEQAQRKKQQKELEELIIAELNHGIN